MHHFSSLNGGVSATLTVAPPANGVFKKIQPINRSSSPISTQSYRNIPQSPVSSSGSSSNNSLRWPSINIKNNPIKNTNFAPQNQRESFVAMSTRKLSLFNRWKNQTLVDTALEGISEEVIR